MNANQLYRTCPINLDTAPIEGAGYRRTRAEVGVVRDAIYLVLRDEHPMTVRQVFYRLVSLGVIRKSEGEYKSTVCRLLGDMRRAQDIPFGWIADNTRWQRKPITYNSMEDALRHTAATYRRSMWADLPAYVEVWLEKDALAGVLMEETQQWDVPLMVTRGYPSLSYVYEAAEMIRSIGKPTYLYYFGDYDPSGLDIPRTVEAGIREFAPSAELHFERVAVNADQIINWRLPTRPTKKTDSRSKGFVGESVEVDAIPSKQLRTLARMCIERHMDSVKLERLMEVERQERRTLRAITDIYVNRP